MMDGIIVDFPAIIKSQLDGGRRMVSVEASVEKTDAEGDIILQKALMDDAGPFVKTGHLDLDHISEIGARMGIADPESYIVGRPTNVVDLGDKRTGVEGEIMRSADGINDPQKNKFDGFWNSLQSKPPVIWRASVYGFPKAGMVVDCSEAACEGGAWRYLIKGMDWRSLAFTRNPVNDSIRGHAKIITAKAFIIAKAGGVPYVPVNNMAGTMPMASASMGQGPIVESYLDAPRSLADAIGQYHHHMKEGCALTCGVNTTLGFKDHFVLCCGMSEPDAELFAHALMHHLLLSRRRSA